MADPFVAEIRIVGFDFPPRGWAHCNGQLMPLSQNTALFALLGTMYGGDGKSNFALPDLQGRVPMQAGQGPGLSHRYQGETGGSETVTLLESELPPHAHGVSGADSRGRSADPAGQAPAQPFGGGARYGQGPTVAMDAVAPAGGGQPHGNLMPSLVLNFVIALQGIFPPRS